jgi:hypothetical protein
VNDDECKSPNPTATEFSDSCKTGANSSICRGMMQKNIDNLAEYISYIEIFNGLPQIFMIFLT